MEEQPILQEKGCRIYGKSFSTHRSPRKTRDVFNDTKNNFTIESMKPQNYEEKNKLKKILLCR